MRAVAPKMLGNAGAQGMVALGGVSAKIMGNVQSSGGTAPALVQQKPGTTAAGSSGLTVTFDDLVTVGNTVIACISFPDTAGYAIEPILDGNFLTHAIDISETGVRSWIYYTHNVPTVENNVAYELDLTVRANMHISEWSGLSNAAPEDTSDATNASSSTLAVVPATLDPTSLKNLVIGIGGYVNATDAYSSGPTDGFTRMDQTGGASVFQEVVYLIRTTDHAEVTSNISLSSALTQATCAASFGGV